MNTEKFFIDSRLPFVEGRCSLSSIRTFKAHIHKDFSVGAVKSGQVCFKTGASSEMLLPGSLALINPETLHSCNSAGKEERSFFMLHLDVEWCVQIQKSLWHTDTFIPTTCSRLDDENLYLQYIEMMESLMNHGVHLLEKEHLLLDLLAAIFRKSVLRQKNLQERSPSTGEVERLKELLASELQEELTLDDLARQLGANPYTMLRRFKANTGITPHAFRTNYRIEQARKYLQQGMEIAEVALMCGFFDQSHLHRHFKAMTTLTPKEYQVNFIQ
jgi:AraC-like DNA-binding protein